MTDIIKVSYENDRPTVLGRDLHEKLNIGTQYTKWMERMCEYGFAENEDYIAISQKRLTAQGNETTYTDHQLTLDMAKQICMIQRTDEGRRYREYFLDIERRWNDPQAVMARSLLYANRQLESITSALKEANAELEELRTKALYADALTSSGTSILVGTLAKLISQKGVSINQKELFAWMREHGYLMAAKGSRRNLPTQSAIDDGLFEIKTHIIVTPSGDVKTSYTPMVTTAGQVYFMKKFLKLK